MSSKFKDRIKVYTTRVDGGLNTVLPPVDRTPERLHDAMRYAVFNGGKRIRPLLVYAAGETLNVDAELLDVPAIAIELIHAFSLIHDDLPAMDDDDLRRGKPAVHKQYDEATAILAADALQPLAFSILASAREGPPDAATKLIKLISEACGSIGMTGGQFIDLAAEGRELSVNAIEHMYSLKTGALIHAAIMSAYILSERSCKNDLRALNNFGKIIGIAFQIKDDILDVVGKTEAIGKPAKSDENQNKATYPSLFGIKKSEARCNELLDQALDELSQLGEASNSLAWLARFIVERGL
ncbi:MAG: geranyl transferase [Gammaproteobacteria bacterium]|nr:geranyl transferase [Gammaproteobacteria bacterium]